MLRVLLLLLLVTGCAHGKSAEFQKPTMFFASMPAHVMASYDMSPDCRGSVAAAVAYLTTIGASMDITWVPEDHPALALEPREGEIAVHAGLTSKRDALAETYHWKTIGGQIARAEVVLSTCTPFTAAHELGHAFGLEHQISCEALMHADADHGGWGLSSVERRWMAPVQ